MENLITNLKWACQALTLLNRTGFPSVRTCEEAISAHERGLPDSESQLHAAAEQLVSGTKHLAHPALTALRESVLLLNAA